MNQRTYIAIDLKSFYASVECRERGLDPLDTNLVVADESRTNKTICLAVTPSLKSYGIPGRARLFEVKRKVREVNARRLSRMRGGSFAGKSASSSELSADPALELDFITAPPRMALYMEYSTRIYGIYMKYVAPEDIIVYSIDEVFMDVTDYLGMHGLSPHGLAKKIIQEVLETTGITATAGIGTNLYLAKIAMDIMAKHIPADENGVRIALLDEMSYRRELWAHRPLTDFWRVGKGYAKKLEANGMYTMGDVARCSETNEELLYHLFGKNAELLIDHAWGWEPCTMQDVKAYKPEKSSLGAGQVLQYAYESDKARLVMREMTDTLVLDLVEKHLVTDQIVITVGYDVENLTDPARRKRYRGKIVTDHYGRQIPQHVSRTHPQMSMHDRAAQFSPFAALTGFDAAVAEEARVTDRRIELEDDEQQRLNEKLRFLSEHIEEQPEVSITYFVPDERKDGGAYVTNTGALKKIDEYEHVLIMTDGVGIPIREIIEVSLEI